MDDTTDDKPTFDSEWFRNLFEAAGKSYRGFAKEYGMDPSAVSRTMSGLRKMQKDEAVAIANFVRAPVSEVMKHAGITIEGQLTPVLLVATINDRGQVERLTDPRPLPPTVLARAKAIIDVVPRVLAAQIRALSGPLTIMDDAVVLFTHTNEVEPSSIGALSICRNFAGEQIFAKIDRARKTGEARVVTIDGKVKEFDLQTATPILTIIP